MKMIYLLIHKSTYGSERKVLRAYEVESEAQDNITLYEGIISGSLEIQPVELVAAARLPDGWRAVGPSPSFQIPGVRAEHGRAELP